jgi:hypothetical protein
MSNKEEQEMELEALESLFPTELVRESSSQFRLVGLVAYPDNSQVNHVSVDIQFSFPLGYPSEESVSWSILKTTGCIATDSSRLGELESVIQSVCDENMGCFVVYQIAERIQEWLRDNNEKEKSLHDMLLERPREERPSRKAVVTFEDDDDDSDFIDDSDYDSSDEDDDDSSFTSEEEPEFEGLQMKNLCAEDERVTRDQFIEWKKEYDEYLLTNGLIKRIGPEDTRRTGKQQFLELLTKRRSENQSEQEFNEELFGNEDDIDEDEFE